MGRHALLAAILCVACLAQPVRAQSDAEVEALRESVEFLSQQLQQMQRSQQADRERIQQLEQVVEEARESASVAQSAPIASPPGDTAGPGNLLNPAITAFVDVGGSLSSDSDDAAYNRFTLREAEVDFSAAVAPFADGVVVVAIGEEIDDPFGDAEIGIAFELEEAYLNAHTLPWDLAAKAGKFRASFGRNNLLHTHDLPQIDRPLAVQAFLGPEGFAPIGAGLDWLVPNPWDRYLQLQASLVNAQGGDESPLLPGVGDNPGVLARLSFFDDVGETGSLDLGTSFLWAKPEGRLDASTLVGADATFLWRDPERPDFRSVLFQGELFWSQSDFEDPIRGIFTEDNFGLYVFAQYQLAQQWYGGLRYDLTGLPGVEYARRNDDAWALSPYLTWYVTEAVRLRLEYQHLERQLEGRWASEEILQLGLSFWFGAHPPHPYWVNR